MRKKRGRGQPPFEPTQASRRKVSIAAGGGMSHEQIAIGLGISRNTLEKHFAVELSSAAYKRRLEVIDAMHKAALNGNVAAQKAYLAADPALSAPPVPTEPKPEPKGKKEQAQDAAVTAQRGTEWEDDLTPRRTLQ